MTVYERIESLRKKRGISQGCLEKELGFSNGSISKWKTSMPKPERLQKIADYFDVSVDYLMTGKEPTSVDYLYTDENADFLIEITRMSKNKDFVTRMKKYMELMNDSKKSVDDMIDFLHAKEHQGED